MTVDSADDGPATSPGSRHLAGWATMAFVFLQLGWILVMPPATGIDEFDHVYRASAVSMGHWQAASVRGSETIARGGFLPVRADLVKAAAPACARLEYTEEFNCRPYRQLRPGVVEVASGVDNYNPAFYAVVGTVARPFRGNAAIYVMRLVAATMCAAAFALAAYLTMRWARTAWPLVALCLACLPTTAYSASLAAPNGLNMMSGLLVWASLAALLSARAEIRTLAYVALMLGVAVLANTHTLGLMWIALVAVAMTAHAGIRAGIALIRPRTWAEAASLVVAVGAIAFEIWWIWYARPNDPARPEGGLLGDRWSHIAISIVVWPLQAVGAFPMRNEAAPIAVYATAVVLLAAFAVAALKPLRTNGPMIRIAAVVMFWTVAVPVALTYVTYHDFGLTWQGRYGMPYSVGLFLVAALALDRSGKTLRQPVVVVGSVAWGLAHVISQVHVLAEQRADTHLISTTGWWAPPSAAVVALTAGATLSWIHAFQLTRAASVGARVG